MNNNKKDMPSLGKWANVGELIGNTLKTVAGALVLAVTIIGLVKEVKKST
ncbi:hypothetical protein JCM17380_16140 [Desulfosporosinus burensis]